MPTSAPDGFTPIVVPTEDFYRIDTALIVPNVDRETWRLRVHGLVDREVMLPTPISWSSSRSSNT